MLHMAPRCERIVSVTSEMKPLWQYGGELVRFYTVQTDGVPGHNVYRLSEYRFEGVPCVGMYMKYVADESALNSTFGVYWRIQKER